MQKQSLGDRMKRYEATSNFLLCRRMPSILRLDGKAFHTLTRGMDRPFDEKFINCMQHCCEVLVRKVDGCDFAYTQSDEISLLLIDYKKLDTQAPFDYRVQKLCSVVASICTAHFNKCFMESFVMNGSEENKNKFFNRVGLFDARVFSVPREDVANYFLWRQRDCTRNSIQMLGQANFSHKQLHKKSCDEIQDMLFKEKGINWNDLETYKKRGSCSYKVKMSDGRSSCVIDTEIPIFSQDREFIEKWICVCQDFGG